MKLTLDLFKKRSAEKMTRMLVIMALLVCSSIVLAAPTTYTSTYNFGCEGLIWDADNGSWAEWLVGSNPTVAWSHQLPDYVVSSQILSADLTIYGTGINNVLCDWDGDGANEQTDLIQVYMNGSLLGNLSGNATTFSLDKATLQSSNACSATLTFVYDRRTTDKLWPVDSAMLCLSQLAVSYDGTAPIPNIVPVPGAVGLGGLGIAFVGWLRTRKS
jgi:hypothetical protein